MEPPPTGGKKVPGLDGTDGVCVPKGPSSGCAGVSDGLFGLFGLLFSEPIFGFKSGVEEPAGPSPGCAGTSSCSNTGMLERVCFGAVGRGSSRVGGQLWGSRCGILIVVGFAVIHR